MTANVIVTEVDFVTANVFVTGVDATGTASHDSAVNDEATANSTGEHANSVSPVNSTSADSGVSTVPDGGGLDDVTHSSGDVSATSRHPELEHTSGNASAKYSAVCHARAYCSHNCPRQLMMIV